MTELNKEQSEKADYLLEIVCNSDTAIDSKVAYDLFNSKEEILYVYSILKKLSLIVIIGDPENDPIYFINWTENTCQFIKDGGFQKKYEQKNNIESNINSANNKEVDSRINNSIMNSFLRKIPLPIFLTIIGGSFALGLFFGNYKFDKDKISMSDENKMLKKDKITIVEKYNFLKDSINSSESKVNFNNNSSQKELLVYNSTSSKKRFNYLNKNNGEGSGYLINPEQLFYKVLLGSVYDYSYHNVDEKLNNIDTLKKGEIIIRTPKKEFILIQ